MIIKSIGSKIANIVHKKDNKAEFASKEDIKIKENSQEFCSKEASDAIANAFIGGQNATKQADDIAPKEDYPKEYYEDDFEEELTEEEKQEEFEIRTKGYTSTVLERLYYRGIYYEDLTPKEMAQKEAREALNEINNAEDLETFLQIVKEAENQIREVAKISPLHNEEYTEQAHEFFNELIKLLEDSYPI